MNMADRSTQAPTYRRHASAEPAAPTRPRTASASVRRNLFQSRLTRRPPQDTRAASEEPVPAPQRPLHTLPQPNPVESQSAQVLSVIADEDDPFTEDDGGRYDPQLEHDQSQESSRGEIVIRDEASMDALDTLDQLMGMIAPDEDEEAAREQRLEMDEEKQRLADAVKTFNKNSIPSQPEELLEAVRKSLRDKTAALAEDNWMYAEEDIPLRQH